MRRLSVVIFWVVLAESLKLTREELKEYQGKNGKTYFACGDLIFDVSEQASFKPGGKDHVFAGEDATYALISLDQTGKDVGVDVETVEISPYMKSTIEQ